jgi:HAD superfamily hydrolase (TIGR01484 family)
VKKLIVFDLDGTLAKSKSSLDGEMAELLGKLLGVIKVAVISGGAWPQFQKQLLTNLPSDDRLKDLLLLPTSGTRFLQYDGKWNQLYAEDFSAAEKAKIIAALTLSFDESGLKPARHWGEIIEDRGSQITLSAMGQDAPLDEKKNWDPDFEKRKVIRKILDPLLPEFSIGLGGSSSIDVTRPGVDKAYGIAKLTEVLGVSVREMIFVGDALFPGGNDYPARRTGVDCIQVRDPDETKRVIETVIACVGDG